MNSTLADLHAERRARQGLPAEPPAPVAEPPAPAVEAPAPAVEAPAQDMDLDDAAPPPPNADDAASTDDSVRSPDAVVVERLIDDEAPSVASSNGGPQCYVCFSSEVTEGNPLLAPCRCNSLIHEQCLRELQGRNLQDPGREQYAHNCQVCQAPYALAPPIIPDVEVKLVDQYQEAVDAAEEEVERALAYAEENSPEGYDEDQLREESWANYGPDANEYDDDGNKFGECRAVTHVRATIKYNGEAVGRAALVLVDRASIARWSGAPNSWDFHSAVEDATEIATDGGTLYDIVTTFFDADGTTPRLECLRAHGDSVGRGQFAYIEAFEIEAPADMDPRTDIATVALQQLHDLVGGWGCAAYVPDARTHLTAEELAACGDQPSFFGRYEKDPAKRRAAYDLARRGIRRDMTPFLRVGFYQVDEVLTECYQNSYLYCIDATWRAIPMSYEEASAPNLVTPAPLLPRPADAELSEFLSSLCTHACSNPISGAMMRKVMMVVAQLVTQQGACVRKARALHYCAAHSQECPALAPLVQLLCSIGGPDAINDADACGVTPLMLAANNVGYDSPDLTMLRMFLACGADTSITNDGLTALGYYRSRVRSRVAFLRGLPDDFGGGPPKIPTLNFEVEGLLMPSDGLGGTAADKAAYDELLGMFETRAAFYGVR